MANFIICCDSNEERKKKFLSQIEPLIAPIEGLVISTISAEVFSVVWAANKKAPVSFFKNDRGLGIIWGDAFCSEYKLTAEKLIDIWDADQDRLFDSFDGFYAAATFKYRSGLVVGTDILGLFPVYYYVSDNIILVGSSPELFKYHPLFYAEFNPAGLVGILLTNSIVDNETLLKGVKRLDAGHALLWPKGNDYREIQQYTIPISTMYFDMPYNAQLHLLDELLSHAIFRYSEEGQIGLLLSGGLDSRTVGGYIKSFRDDTLAFTIGENTDIEMQCAIKVAKSLTMQHHAFPIENDRYPLYANLQTTWEHCANGFNNIWGWGIPSQIKNFPQRIATGFILDVALGGAFPKAINKALSFDTLFQQDNSWGVAPDTLTTLLKINIFGDLIQALIRKLKIQYEKYADYETKRILCYKLRHRQRFHVGGVVWQISFGSWPILPILDKQILEVIGGLPAATLSERRAQKDLLCLKFPNLAAIPLDTNSYKPVILRPRLRHLLSNYLQDRVKPLNNCLNGLRFGEKIEKRHYYRLYDFNNPGWVEVRRQAEKYRDCAADFFNMDVFNKLLPPPETKIHFKDGISDASGLKNLLGFLLWTGKRNADTL